MDPLPEKTKELLRIICEPSEEDVLKLSEIFFSSTVLSRGVSWKELKELHPAKILFFTGGVNRIIMHLREHVLGIGNGDIPADNSVVPGEDIKATSEGTVGLS